MDYHDHKITIEQKKLTDFIYQLSEGTFHIPSFQRYFVWDPEHIVSLWDSIYRGYPIGSILYWKTPVRLHIHRKLGGFYIPRDGKKQRKIHSYILDGQQRVTSLFISFFGGTGKVKEQTGFNYTLYFDLSKAEFFFENELYKRRWDVPANLLLKVKEVPKLPADFIESLSTVAGYEPQIRSNLEQLQYIFTDYRIPLICLRNFNIAGVCDIYERMNQTGVKLENMDIIIARNFRNNPTVIEEDFNP